MVLSITIKSKVLEIVDKDWPHEKLNWQPIGMRRESFKISWIFHLAHMGKGTHV
jgi:hypothetical protein